MFFLLALLDAVESFCYDPDYGTNPHLTLVGKKGKREVVIEICLAMTEPAEIGAEA
jgi:hypothetical protein